MATGETTTTGLSVILLTRDLTLAGRLKKYIISGGYLMAGVAADISSLFRLLFDDNPDLVIVDIAAGSIAECGEAISFIQHAYYTPVILLGARGDRSIFELTRSSEPAGIIVKPPKREEFLSLVMLILQRSTPFSGKSKGPRMRSYNDGNLASRCVDI